MQGNNSNTKAFPETTRSSGAAYFDTLCVKM
jgi:hypothetical protein